MPWSLKTLREAEGAVGATEIEISKRLYVGNLPPSTGTDELRDTFVGAGLSIADIRYGPASVRQPLALVCIRGYGRWKKCNGEAVDSRGLVVRGRQLVIHEAFQPVDQVDQPRRGRTPSIDATERLYIAGLPYSATEQGVRQLFQNHGLSPVEIYVPRDRQTGRVRGIGFVAMNSTTEAVQAIGALNGSLVEGKSLTVKAAKPR